MSPWLEVAVAVAMVVGLVGLVVPVLPGLALMWIAVGAWTILDGGGAVRWVTFAVVSILALVGTVAAILWSGRQASGAGAPWWALLVAIVGSVIGFITIPLVGIVIGGVGGLWLAELLRLRHPRAAWDTTWAALQGYGVGTVVQMLAGAAVFGVWLVGVWVS